MPEPRTDLYLFGAFDRFNFGDLLFPVLLSRALAHAGTPPRAVGLRPSDLSAQGALPTLGLRTLLQPGAVPPGSWVILAGGEVLTAQWYLMLRYLLPLGLWLPARVLERCLPRAWLNQLSRQAIGARSELPFAVAPEDFPAPVRVAYNAVGGCTLEQLDPGQRKILARKLHNACYVSVRDRTTERKLKQLAPQLQVWLAPDSGILVADVYPADDLAARPLAAELGAIYPDGYFCFQTARYLAQRELGSIVDQLRAIRRDYGLGIVLLPLGRAAEHEDQLALGAIQQRLPEARLIGDSQLEDLVAVIAGARVFAGTSLHGNIAAMAYGVPHLGLTRRVEKLRAYLETWASPEFADCVEFRELARRTGQAMTAPLAGLSAARARQLQQARLNLARLADEIKQQDTLSS